VDRSALIVATTVFVHFSGKLKLDLHSTAFCLLCDVMFLCFRNNAQEMVTITNSHGWEEGIRAGITANDFPGISPPVVSIYAAVGKGIAVEDIIDLLLIPTTPVM